ncbi:MAG: acyl-CoA thioesterase [Gammaproteobacteria bacterium]|nr:acyl-CoA thioesterase [Gammaproteobacteria bacterium]MCW8988899.1 acyl-CoA thioesterase [Gammaproteobacteria bacterium]MCW9030393.1 acyl-CoA thioesterase [Gammaproteobacteria bacterium]
MDIDKNKQPEIRVLPMPSDTNASGDIFGGWLMSQVDIAGSIAAHRRVGNRVVTVAVNEFIFIKPVSVGDLVSIYAEVTHIGNTSIQITLNVFSENERGNGNAQKVAEAILTYVSMDDNNKPKVIS